MPFKLITEAGAIRLGATVTKIKGEKLYHILDRLKVYDETGKSRELLAYAGSRFIVGADASVNAVSETTELVWLIEEWEMLKLLEELR